MALINIEYGSLASSETMNQNFLYLEDKIADNNESIMTSISSILSNIATINSRINDISDQLLDSNDSLSSKINDYKTKTKILVNNALMIPNWAGTKSIDLTSTYTASSNGYLLLIPLGDAKGNIVINNFSLPIKTLTYTSEKSSQLITLPVREGDRILCEISLQHSYFTPVKEVSVNGF